MLHVDYIIELAGISLIIFAFLIVHLACSPLREGEEECEEYTAESTYKPNI